jgi:hypothetical protein
LKQAEGSKKMEETKRAVLVIGQLLGTTLGEDFTIPASKTIYAYLDAHISSTA